MKAGTPNHPKTKRFAKELQIPLCLAVGVLELLWHMAADFCGEGNIGKFSDEEIAGQLEWPGDPSALVAALAKTGWLDKDEVHRYVIHDWLDHCPEYIKERVWKRKQRAAKSNKQTTYENSSLDITGQQPTCPPNGGNVRSIPTPPHPTPTNPTPPPPTDGQGQDKAEEGKISWTSLQSILKALGMGDAKTALAHAKKAGLTPAAVGAIIAHFEANPGAWDIGGLHHRISNATRDELPADNWLPVKSAANGTNGKSLPVFSGRRGSKSVEAAV